MSGDEMAEALLAMGPVGVPLECEAPVPDGVSFWQEGTRRDRGETWTVERLHHGKHFYTFCLDR